MPKIGVWLSWQWSGRCLTFTHWRCLCQPRTQRLGAALAPTALSRLLELVFTTQRLPARLTSPTSADIIRELEQMAAELAEKRKISYTAATCCLQVLPSPASRGDDSSDDGRGAAGAGCCCNNIP